MRDAHEESKRKNFNPYVFNAQNQNKDRKAIVTSSNTASEGKSGVLNANVNPLDLSIKTVNIINEGKEFPCVGFGLSPRGDHVMSEDSNISQDRLGYFRMPERTLIARTYEDITVTDTSRYVLN
jgi:hypothetical protein